MLEKNPLLRPMISYVAFTEFGYCYFFSNVALSKFACGYYVVSMLRPVRFDVAITCCNVLLCMKFSSEMLHETFLYVAT